MYQTRLFQAMAQTPNYYSHILLVSILDVVTIQRFSISVEFSKPLVFYPKGSEIQFYKILPNIIKASIVS